MLWVEPCWLNVPNLVKKNQLANQNNIPRNIYFSDFSNSGLLVRYLRLLAFDELIKHL